jgi:uncharacterized protein with ParB-like and HNH nuclease domain
MSTHNGVIDLINAIDTKLQKVHTQSLDLSFNELLDMHKEGELKIDPEYQRIFRWSEGTRSRFIESLLLEMPVPPIYVIEEVDGKYLLIDGLQRISSYLHLRGQLEAPHLEPAVKMGEKLKLIDCDIVQELNGKTYDDLGAALQIRLKRAFIRVEVVRKGSDPRFKYHMFKRLNTGGNILSPQQIRNSSIRLLDSTFNDFIIKMSKNKDFEFCTQYLSYEQTLEAYDQELVLRFFALKNDRPNFTHSVADFLTDYMESVSDTELGRNINFNYLLEQSVFEKTFKVLAISIGEHSFGYTNKSRNNLIRGFGIYHYEAFTIGLQCILDKLNESDTEQMLLLQNVIRQIKLDPAFINLTTGGGKNSRGQMNARIDFVENKLKEAF